MTRRPPSHRAPGRGGDGELRAPGRHAPPPPVGDRLAPPETRVEYLDGGELYTAPANPPHATRHFDLTYVLGAHVAGGYRGAVDMLTRADAASDFAPDASIFSAEPDPATGNRRLEELAFEITDTQALSVPTEKARKLAARGVRRVFCIVVKQRRLLEWSRETEAWRTLPQGAVIEDPCLIRPLPVASLLDHAAADEAVVRALLDKRVPALDAALAAEKEAGRAQGRSEGRVETLQGAIRAVLETRGFVVSDAAARGIAACADPATLAGWLRRAASDAADAEALLRELSSARRR